MKKGIIFLLVVLCLISCRNRMTNYEGKLVKEKAVICKEVACDMVPPPVMESVVDASSGKQYLVKQDRKIIKSATVSIVVTNMNNVKGSLDSIVKRVQGSVVRENYSNDDYQEKVEMIIKVPASAFEEFMKKIETVHCSITSKNVRSEDITADYIDLETRIKNKKQLEQRYLELLKRATKVEEMLDIDEKAEGVRTEIETMEGKMKLYNNEIAYSVISMDISKQKEIKKSITHVPLDFLENLKESLYDGWVLVISFILFFLRLWAFWIVTFVVIFYVRRWRRKLREKK